MKTVDDYREEVMNRILIGLYSIGVDNIEMVKPMLIGVIGDYEIDDRCTDVAIYNVDHDYELIKLFLATKRTEGGRKSTVKTRTSVYRRFLQDVGKPLQQITAFDIRIWLAEIQNRVCLRTANSYRTQLLSLFTWLTEEGFLEKNPMKNIKPIKYPNSLGSAFSTTDIDALRCACRNLRERAMIEVLLSSGIRCQELCNLKWEHIDLHTKEVLVLEGKGNKNRLTLIDEIARKYLIAYKNSLDYECEYVFATKWHGQYRQRATNSVWKMLRAIGVRAGVSDVHPHRFRHTFATTLYKRGMDAHMIQRLLGHSQIATSFLYIGRDEEALKNAYKQCE